MDTISDIDTIYKNNNFTIDDLLNQIEIINISFEQTDAIKFLVLQLTSLFIQQKNIIESLKNDMYFKEKIDVDKLAIFYKKILTMKYTIFYGHLINNIKYQENNIVKILNILAFDNKIIDKFIKDVNNLQEDENISKLLTSYHIEDYIIQFTKLIDNLFTINQISKCYDIKILNEYFNIDVIFEKINVQNNIEYPLDNFIDFTKKDKPEKQLIDSNFNSSENITDINKNQHSEKTNKKINWLCFCYKYKN